MREEFQTQGHRNGRTQDIPHWTDARAVYYPCALTMQERRIMHGMRGHKGAILGNKVNSQRLWEGGLVGLKGKSDPWLSHGLM